MEECCEGEEGGWRVLEGGWEGSWIIGVCREGGVGGWIVLGKVRKGGRECLEGV